MGNNARYWKNIELNLENAMEFLRTVLNVLFFIVPPVTFLNVFGVSCLSSTAVFGASIDSKITVDNYFDAEVVLYPVVLLRGRVEDGGSSTVIVENLSSSSSSRITRTRSLDGRYKALVELTEGENHLSIASGASRMDITLFYRRSFNEHFVRLILFFDSSSNEEIDVPSDWLKGRSPEFQTKSDPVRKLQIAALLWQTATAERLYDAGYGRRTFTLETDRNGQIVVWKQHGKKNREEYSTKSDVELFREIYNEIVSGAAFDKNACYFVLTSLDGKKCEFKREYARIALGVDNIAMLDSVAFFSCPDSLADVSECFSDPTAVSSNWSRDSAYRNTRWALTSSTLGAGLHELGHAFGLGHCVDSNDFMSRGFDRFNRIFTLFEPPSSFSEGGEFNDNDVVEWTSSTAPKLIRSPWIE